MNVELAKQVIFEDDSDFETVTGVKISDQSHWMIYFSQVFKHVPTGHLWKISWSRAATETQDDGLEDITFCRVN